MEHLERARQLRADTGVHYNCCQSVLVPFAQKNIITVFYCLLVDRKSTRLNSSHS